MALDKRVVEFRRDDLRHAFDALSEVIDRGDGWVNIEPVVDEEALEQLRASAPPAVIRLFSGRGSKIPFGTFVIGKDDKPSQVGLDHASGPRTVPKLEAAGIAAPEGWKLRQDHGKRGIVYDVSTVQVGALLNWILDAGTYLAEIELTGWWSAAVYRRR